MPLSSYFQQAKKTRLYYDPLGNVVKTINPDNSEQRVVKGIPINITQPPTSPYKISNKYKPSPWENYTYDANDLASVTHEGQQSAQTGVSSTHYFTPKSAEVDALQRTIQTTEHNATTTAENVVMNYEYDIRGNLKKVTDALDRTAFSHIYDLRPKEKNDKGEEQPLTPLITFHIDKGISTLLADIAGKLVQVTDAKDTQALSAFDTLGRPIKIWAKDKTGEDITLRQKLIYGDDISDGPASPENTNHLGKLYKHYDEAGLVTFDEYDFKGNVLQKTREVIANSEILSVFTPSPTDWVVECFRVDWDNAPTLEGEYITNTEYDALNRVTKLTYPEDLDTERKELLPVYNNAGALEKVTLGSDTYVDHIAYNAKGQRLLIAFGNDTMTRYSYDSNTFRLARQRSEGYTKTDWTFETAGTVLQDTGYEYDLAGNIIKIKERTTSCGVGGTNSLDRNFNYDPLYRLLKATGRENSPTITPIWDDSYRSNDNSITTAYTQNYQYDKMGNIQQLQHIGNNSFTRNFDYNSDNNKLQNISIGMDDYIFTYDENGNQITENSERHFEWDSVDKLRCFFVQAGTSEPTKYAHYLYDAGGNRIKKLVRVAGGNYASTTNIDGLFEYKTDGTHEQNTLHVMDDKSRIATIRIGDDFGDTTPEVKYVLEDHLGNSTSEIDGNGTLIEKEEYYPFGETSFASYQKKRFKYNSKERDEESGLYNYGMRYYSAWTCRFVSVDPLRDKYPELTPYQYASNKPINLIDLDGLEGVKRVDHQNRTTTIMININYVPKNKETKGKGNNSGFTEKQIQKIKKGVAKEISQKDFLDMENFDQFGPYKVNFEINFVKQQDMKSLKMAVWVPNNENNYNVQLVKGKTKTVIDESGQSGIEKAETTYRRITLSGTDSHTATHEIFHSLTHMLNIPEDLKK
ncbi:MAG: RHS repeat domain-containing protein, partial [Bacteroidia bacterium]